MQVLRVFHLIRGYKPRPNGAEGVVGFALGPLAGTLHLKFALGEVVDSAITRHVFQRVSFLDVLGAGADDHTQFHFPIGFLGFGRKGYIVVGA